MLKYIPVGRLVRPCSNFAMCGCEGCEWHNKCLTLSLLTLADTGTLGLYYNSISFSCLTAGTGVENVNLSYIFNVAISLNT